MEKDAEKTSFVKTMNEKSKAHYTHIECSEGIELSRCEEGDCSCLMVHCPFCDVQHFKPSGSMRVRDHITQSHFKYSVTMGNTLIVKCFHKCTNTPGHFHCVFCDQQVYKRKAFVYHLQSHLKKMGKDADAVYFFYNNQPATIGFDGASIELCRKACEGTLGQHYHCPVCKKRNFSNMGVMVTHLWRCQDRNKYRRRLPWLQKTDGYLHNDKYVPALQEILGDKWHCSIVRTVDDLPVVQCDLDECCDKKYHCALCLPAHFKPGLYSELQQHYVSHWSNRVSYLDYSILDCCLDCEVKNKDLSVLVQSHYHCPVCGQTHRSKQLLMNHLTKCAKGDNSSELEPLEAQMNEDILVTVDGVKNSSSDNPFNDDIVDRLPEEVDEPQIKIEMFEMITAVLCKEMIKLLEKRSNDTISDILDDVTSRSGSKWTWSPGIQDRVYALTGQLENLQEAKRFLIQKLTTDDNKDKTGRIVSTEDSSISKSTVSTQTDSPKLNTTEPMRTTVHDDDTLGTMTHSTIDLEEPNTGESNYLDASDLQDQNTTKRKQKNVDEKIVLKKKRGRPRKYPLDSKEDKNEVPKHSDVNRVSLSVRRLSRVSSSPYSRRKSRLGSSTPFNPATDNTVVNDAQKTQNVITHKKTESTNVVASQYETRGKKVNFSLLATGKEKKVTKLSLKSKEIKISENKTTLKEMYVSLVDINKSKKFRPKQQDDEMISDDDDVDIWEDDYDNDPDFVPDTKKKKSDSDADSSADTNKLGNVHNSVNRPAGKNKFDDETVNKMSDSDDDNFDDASEQKKDLVSVNTEMTVKNKRIKNLHGKNPVFYVPQITVPFVALHQSMQRLKNSDDTDYINIVADDGNLKCFNCDFTAQSSADLAEHVNISHKQEPIRPCPVCGKKFVTRQCRALHMTSMQCKAKLFRCLKCSFTSQQFADVTDHLITEHDVVNPLRCDVCEKRVIDKHKHLKNFHFPKNCLMPNVDWACQFCQFMSDEFSDVTDHMIQSHDIADPLRCDVCEVTFKQSKLYHMKLKHGPLNKYYYDKSTSCLLCRTTFELFSDLTQHIIEEHDMVNVRCDVCEMIFKSTDALCDHVDKMHGPFDIHCCNICGRGFNSVQALKKHKQMIHDVETKLLKSCKKCNFKTSSKKELRLHMKTHVSRNECQICHKILAKNTNLMMHIDLMHTKQQDCVCNICGKSFRHPLYLRLHLGRHSGNKTHVCSVCGKRFYASNTLHSHMEIHKKPNERTYRHVCSVCGRGFNGKTNLDDHMNKHTGAKPHSCPICGIKFGFRSMLYKHHQFVHSDLRPYPCSFCSKSYKSKQRLTAHIVSHTGVSQFNCDQCKKAFSTSSTLKHHIPRCRGEKHGQNSTRNNILQTYSTDGEIVIQLVSGEEGVVKMEPVEQTDVVQIVEEISEVEEVIEEVNTGDQISQVYLCSVCATTFQTYQEAERHIAEEHVEPEPKEEFQLMQTNATNAVVPKQEVLAYW